MKAEGKAPANDPRASCGRESVHEMAGRSWQAGPRSLAEWLVRPDLKTDRRRRWRDVATGRMALPLRGDTGGRSEGRHEPFRSRRPVRRRDSTGLRSGELRSLTKPDLFLAATTLRPLQSREHQNQQEARQYIQADLAAELRRIVATKTPSANVFTLPDEWSMADMLVETWPRPERLARRSEARSETPAPMREESDFLTVRIIKGKSRLPFATPHMRFLAGAARHSAERYQDRHAAFRRSL